MSSPPTNSQPQTNGTYSNNNNNNNNNLNSPSQDTNGYGTTKQETLFNNTPAFTPRTLHIVTIGAGFSGLLMAHKLQHRFPEMQAYIKHTIYERHDQIGGTWLTNTYPGIQCDVPSHIYAFPFDPNPNWSRFYSSGAEIQAYIVATARKWNLDRDVMLGHAVTEAKWLEEEGKWRLTVEHAGATKDDYCDVLISAQGVLADRSEENPTSHHKWPEIPGLHSFNGHVTHSAQWRHDYDYSNKRIAVIGNGSSGIQIVPRLQSLPGTQVTNFIRGPTWVYYRVPPSKHLGRETDDPNPAYTEDEKRRWRESPEKLKQLRKGMIDRTNKAFKMFIKGSEANEAAMRFAAEQMAGKLGHDPVLCKKMIPSWEVGCRRITPGPGYLESFTQPNCRLSDSRISRISSTAVHTEDGEVHEVDVGYDVSHRPRYPIIGRSGIELADQWRQEPRSYMSVAAADMPNFFILMGPNAVVGHGSLMEALNWTGDYVCRWLSKIACEDIASIEPRREVVEEFVRYADEIHRTLVWSGDCVSWYKNGRRDGRVTGLFGGSAVLFNRLISSIRGEDFDIRYRSANRFRCLGNGFTAREFDDDADLAWYVEK